MIDETRARLTLYRPTRLQSHFPTNISRLPETVLVSRLPSALHGIWRGGRDCDLIWVDNLVALCLHDGKDPFEVVLPRRRVRSVAYRGPGSRAFIAALELARECFDFNNVQRRPTAPNYQISELRRVVGRRRLLQCQLASLHDAEPGYASYRVSFEKFFPRTLTAFKPNWTPRAGA